MKSLVIIPPNEENKSPGCVRIRSKACAGELGLLMRGATKALRLMLILLSAFMLAHVASYATCQYSWTDVGANTHTEWGDGCVTISGYGQTTDCPWPCGVTWNMYMTDTRCTYGSINCHTVTNYYYSDGEPYDENGNPVTESCDPVTDTICEQPVYTTTDDITFYCLYS